MSLDLSAEIRGSTIRIIANITDFPNPTTPTTPGSVVDPDSQSIQVYDGTGAAQGSPIINPSHLSTGLYYIDYPISGTGNPGIWRVDWSILKGTLPSIGRMEFTVIS